MYDSTNDTLEHIDLVRTFLQQIINALFKRAALHDASKLEEPEKTLYDTYKPKIQEVESEFGYGSPQYEAMVKELGEAFQVHFSKNRHHPEYHPNGINDMTLIDLVEMLCDWKAAASRYGKSPNMEANKKRFGVSDQLDQILRNTLREMDW